MRVVIVVSCGLLALVTGARAGVGRFALVQNQVTSLKPGAASAVPAHVGMEVVLDEREETGAASGAKLLFGAGGVITLGERTQFVVTRDAAMQAAGQDVGLFRMLIGKVRVFVSRFWSGRPPVRVETPTSVVGIKGSDVGVEVDEKGATLVSVFSGHADVLVRAAREEQLIELSAGEQLSIDANGRSKQTILGGGKSGAAIAVSQPSSASAIWADPASSITPSVADDGCHCEPRP